MVGNPQNGARNGGNKKSPRTGGRRVSKWQRTRMARRRMRVVFSWVAALLVVGAVASLVGVNLGHSGGLNTTLHQHPHIVIDVQGSLVDIPANIGIDPNLWKDHSMDEYQEMATMSPLHTHDSSGTIHLEMGKWHPCTLGNFFDIWGKPFDRDKVLTYNGDVSLTVDGKPNDQFRDLVLQDGQQIVIRGG